MTAETIANPSETLPAESAGIEALLTGAAFARVDSVGFLRVTGDDRVRWLNGMATNSIQALGPGEGCYTFFLNAQGRIQGDATAWMLEDAILLEAGRDQIPALTAHLDRFIVMDDVELAPPALEGLLIAGPQAGELLAVLGFLDSASITSTETLTLTHTALASQPVDLIRGHSPLVPRFELWAAAATIQLISAKLRSAGIPEATPEALHQLRLLEGTPVYGIDIRDKDLPQETAQTRALHFAKGCYLGQEIVERIRSRGNVHRSLSGFILTGSVPAGGTPLFAEALDKPVGELTSAAEVSLPTGAITLALGYIRREALDRGIQLTYDGGTAMPITLPLNLATFSKEPERTQT